MPLLPFTPENNQRLLVVLDLDLTLVHAIALSADQPVDETRQIVISNAGPTEQQ